MNYTFWQPWHNFFLRRCSRESSAWGETLWLSRKVILKENKYSWKGENPLYCRRTFWRVSIVQIWKAWTLNFYTVGTLQIQCGAHLSWSWSSSSSSSSSSSYLSWSSSSSWSWSSTSGVVEIYKSVLHIYHDHHPHHPLSEKSDIIIIIILINIWWGRDL